jgi:hypothetical protein
LGNDCALRAAIRALLRGVVLGIPREIWHAWTLRTARRDLALQIQAGDISPENVHSRSVAGHRPRNSASC